VIVAIVLIAVAVVLVVALLSAVGAGMLARIDGTTWSTALTRAAGAFAAVLALAAAVTAALAPFLT
jgi:preprotein translocase subunit SecG